MPWASSTPVAPPDNQKRLGASGSLGGPLGKGGWLLLSQVMIHHDAVVAQGAIGCLASTGILEGANPQRVDEIESD